ncbi:DNA integrity scanning diadenylate cyclase DisA [Clostridium cellulovorans]|uniref:DNA integrity scanning protein DisA n=1 Tax=Clostridium cellulovorans (strain ATCC 35296 / DSM 3052 / OCM 3 / 743B) TaxID=573061 RepID=D9SXC5_CLOC7|nr:DNA integrity scanning diadenylate cyclase DisA [Clostridium cellulovorans]ADL53428.1 DNA integrity scanning, DisA, linker region [Clostridium cellulovorans 743B]
MTTQRGVKDQNIMDILKRIAPGTQLREGLENILRAKTGGLIILGNSDQLMKIVDGGFKINADYNPAYLYELAKMDGAIILSNDLKKIICANTQLIPDFSIHTFETGTRHRTAQRVAKQFGVIAVAISQRRNVITVFKDDIKYVLRDSSTVLARANQAIQTLEKYVAVLDRIISNVNVLEFQDMVTLFDIATAIQRTELVLRIVAEIESFVIELGVEGRLISMQMGELIRNVEREGLLIIRDYCVVSDDCEQVYESFQQLDDDEILELDMIAKVLGYPELPLMDTLISPRGYRMTNKIPRLPIAVINNLVNSFDNFQEILKASIEDLDKVEGIGEARAKAIKNGLRRLREQSMLDVKA